jgi:putative ABC transport system permease protein
MPHDLHEALRSILRTPVLSGAVVLSLGLGIGLNTAVFSVVQAVLLRPLPYDRPQELVQVRGVLTSDGVADVLLPGSVFAELRRSTTTLTDVAAVAAIRENLTGAGLPAQVQVGWVSENLFRMLGVRPSLGRDFAADEPPGRILLGHSFWRRHFAGDPQAVGRRVFLDGFSYEIVGVMPAGFRLELPRLPADVDVWKAPDSWWQNGDVWGSKSLDAGLLRLVARLRPGTTPAAARGELEAFSKRLRERDVKFERAGLLLEPDSLQAALVGRVRRVLWLLLGATVAVLLVACSNVMNLQLVRGQRRAREFATRRALGASRARIVRLLLLEALLLSGAGGVLGLALGGSAMRLVRMLRPAGLPHVERVQLDPAVLAFAAALCVGATLLFGLLPALMATRRDLTSELQGGRSTAVPKRLRLSATLVAAQVAFSLVLLVTGALLGQSLARLEATPLGFDGGGLLTFTVSLPGAHYERPAGPDQFLSRLENAIESLPGARSAGAIWPLPFSERRWSSPWEAGDAVSGESTAYADYRLVTGGAFETLGAVVLEGRTFAPEDARHSVVVSRSVAERAFPGRSAIGRSLRASPWGGDLEAFQIVGVVEDQRHRTRREAPADALYFDSRGWAWTDWEVGVAVRSEGDARNLVEPIRREVARLDPEVPMADVRTMQERIDADTQGQRLLFGLLGAFAAVALTLALVGLYGVMAWSVSQRGREFAIRLALGASREHIVGGVLGRAALIVVAGSAVGVPASVALNRLLAGFLFGVSPGDPRALLWVATGLLCAALAAAWVPARRAAAVEAASALRAE